MAHKDSSTLKKQHLLTSIDERLHTAICSQCGPAPLSLTGYRKSGRRRYRCGFQRRRESRAYKYRKKYGYDIKSAAIPTKCELCEGSYRIAYDHCHKTGKFRGWLCMKCNTALGLVNDDVEMLKKLIAYLER